MNSERRKYPRHLSAGRSLFVSDRYSEKVATLRDISTGGMRLSYSPGKATCNQWTLVDLFNGVRDKILIMGLACEMIYDVTSLMENGSFSGTDERICGVRFDKMTKLQKNGLDRLFESIV